jgi:dihydrofolate reductase
MPGPPAIEGYAIVSEDGMLANAERVIPDAMKVEADQKFFHDGLARAAAIVHGRHSHEGGTRGAGRHRLIVTRTRTKSLAPNPAYAKSLFWNPRGATLDDALAALGAPAGTVAVIGGPEVYELFLDIGYDAFHLTRAAGVRIPGGKPVFPEIGPDRTPEDVLADHGLKPGPQRVLDADAGVTLVTWTR